MKKRILLSLLCAAALVICAGCGSSASGENGSGEGASSQVEEKTSFGVGETYEEDGVMPTTRPSALVSAPPTSRART